MNQVLDKEKLIARIRESMLPDYLSQLEMDILVYCIEESVIKDINLEWILCRKQLPEKLTDVQVTYLGYNDHLPYCNAFAYLNDDGDWFWSHDDGEVIVKIIAWKPMCEPYKGN